MKKKCVEVFFSILLCASCAVYAQGSGSEGLSPRDLFALDGYSGLSETCLIKPTSNLEKQQLTLLTSLSRDAAKIIKRYAHLSKKHHGNVFLQLEYTQAKNMLAWYTDLMAKTYEVNGQNETDPTEYAKVLCVPGLREGGVLLLGLAATANAWSKVHQSINTVSEPVFQTTVLKQLNAYALFLSSAMLLNDSLFPALVFQQAAGPPDDLSDDEDDEDKIPENEIECINNCMRQAARLFSDKLGDHRAMSAFLNDCAMQCIAMFGGIY